jgi:hypothetical protein
MLEKMTRKIANFPDDAQVELFCTVTNFPAIMYPILEKTSNQLAGFLRAVVNFLFISHVHLNKLAEARAPAP